MKIGVLTGGGDCPGLNPAIRGIVLRAMDFGYEVVGIQDGWKGLVNGEIQPLGLKDVEEIISQGGTILGTSRTNPFKKEGDKEKVLENIKKLGLDAIIAIGGEDTLGVAEKFYQLGVKIVGVPKTMDNDLSCTDYTFGFDSAVTVAVDALERLRDTAKSHRRIMILEVMGRYAGWVSLFTGIAGGADWILIPEITVDLDKMCEHLKKSRQRGKLYGLIVTSEAVELPGISEEEQEKDAFGHVILKEKGVGEKLADEINKRTGIETRAAVIGHIQRGGAPTVFDRILGIRVGIKAVELIANREFGQMACLKGNEVEGASLKEATAQLKMVSEQWCKLAQTLFK
ncbi:MAG: ATP-dependent 6-phosphofructokinase [Planctomycetota bacterium]